WWRNHTSLQVFALITSAIVTVLEAIPLHVVLRQHKRTGVLTYVSVGGFLGTTPFLLYLALALPAILTRGALRLLPLGNLARLSSIGAIAGSAAALAFWLIAVRESRPSGNSEEEQA